MAIYDAIMETGVLVRKRSDKHDRSPKRKKHKRSKSKEKTKIENNKENKALVATNSSNLDDSVICID